MTATPTEIQLYVTALAICFDPWHPLRARIPELEDAPDSDAVALLLFDFYALARSA